MELFSHSRRSVAGTLLDFEKYLAYGFIRTNCTDYCCDVDCLKSKTTFYFCKNL